MKIENIEELEKIANNVRIGIIEAVHAAKSGHPGGSLSIADILTVLYFNQMNIDPKDPKNENRDRFVLSKGHASPVLYATLAERGFFDKEELKSLENEISDRFFLKFDVQVGNSELDDRRVELMKTYIIRSNDFLK